MADIEYEFCKIFLRSDDQLIIKATLATLLGGEFQRRSMRLENVTVDVLSNPDKGVEDDFVRWPTFVEVEAADETSNAVVVTIVSRIIEAMWGMHIPAVAACSFEDELPWLGGIRRLDQQGYPDGVL